MSTVGDTTVKQLSFIKVQTITSIKVKAIKTADKTSFSFMTHANQAVVILAKRKNYINSKYDSGSNDQWFSTLNC